MVYSMQAISLERRVRLKTQALRGLLNQCEDARERLRLERLSEEILRTGAPASTGPQRCWQVRAPAQSVDMARGADDAFELAHRAAQPQRPGRAVAALAGMALLLWFAGASLLFVKPLLGATLSVAAMMATVASLARWLQGSAALGKDDEVDCQAVEPAPPPAASSAAWRASAPR